jgi:hypothetical protein
MKTTGVCLTMLWVLFSFASAPAENDRLYGEVYTGEGEVYQGIIRWDDHEAFWSDVLDGTKEIESYSYPEERQRRREIEIFGLTISWTEDEGDDDGDRRFGIRLGRLTSIQRRSRGSALLTLRDNTRIKVSSSGTDIGSSNRGILVHDPNVGWVTVDWSDFEKVVFAPSPESEDDADQWRLFGTVTVWDGSQFRGFIRWDDDECVSTDILDGESRDEELEIPFSKIRAIERASSSSSRVELANGQKIRLRGTNDVNEDNRGIVVDVPDFGQVTVEWEDFERAEFEKPNPALSKGYRQYDAGQPLYGTVWDNAGDRWQGRIRWDDDEAMTYEFLDGEMDDLDVRIEFSDIRSIKRRSRRSALVQFEGGETVILKGTCDVNDENRGIFVEETDGQMIHLYWDEFDRVEFGHP